ncbi:Homoserine O-acetyltransferase FUB5 [Fusarium oxysporum f. sp. cubense]|uniref:Homoserine O-acetyltransferase FUB5 n=1 Tax=Fusarium oxysporum f. sp. cubense TaxID=61366 RepID=A0A559L328_FUSOC|nr:Homoserine O-acetyltransferase FUB5 [Fusarium oxysporum f. sp. cubense]
MDQSSCITRTTWRSETIVYNWCNDCRRTVVIDYHAKQRGSDQRNRGLTVKGQLNTQRTNAVVICHALSGSADVEDWWSLLLSRPENPDLDPDRFCIMCCSSLGTPYGSSSPLSVRPGTASYYGHLFPKTTIRNDVRIQLIIVELLEVRSIYCVTGGSLGGMMALEWALLGKHFVRSMVLVATAARQSHWAIAWSENQLATIKPDSKFRGGRYGGDPPRDGLAAARMAAMISYRKHSSFEKRFGRRRLETCTTPNRMLSKVSGTRNGTRAPFAVDVQRAERDDGHYDNSGIFLAQSYLRYQGEKFNARFDANCYLHILDKIDCHDIARVRYPSLSDDEAILKVLSQIRKLTLVVGVPTDGLYPPSEQVFLSQGLKNATFATLQSDGGHDAFLIQGEQLNE